MIKKTYWNLSVWPESLGMHSGDMKKYGVIRGPYMTVDQVQYQSYVIGFFGFHYIRAINENETVLQQETSRILSRLVSIFDLDANITKQLLSLKKQSYIHFWENVLIKVSLAVGDSQGQQVQYGIRLSYWLAALYACLFGVLDVKESGQAKECLAVLKKCIPELVISAQKAKIPPKAYKPLVELTEFLQNPKSYSSACKCMKKLELVIRELLWPERVV